MMHAPAQKRRDLFVGLGLAAAALLVAFTGGLMSPSNWLTPSQSPSLYPAACLIGVALCGLIIARGGAASSSLGTAAAVSLRAVGMGILMAIYAIALPHVGLILSTVVLLLTVPLVLGYRNWGGIVLFGAIVLGAAWLIFIKVMEVPLKL
jgi:hypothetical protein